MWIGDGDISKNMNGMLTLAKNLGLPQNFWVSTKKRATEAALYPTRRGTITSKFF